MEMPAPSKPPGRRRPAAALLLVILLLATPGAAPAQGLGADAGARADACGKVLLKAAASFVAARLKLVGGCAERLLACIQTKPAGTKRDACVAKAAAKCGAALARLDGVAGKLTAALGKKCADLGVDALLDGAGLGFGALAAAECASALGRPLATVADLAACVALRQACHADAVLGAATPRAKSILRATGVLAGGADPLPCLPDHLGDDAAVADPATTGKALDKCTRGARKAGSAFVAKKLKALGGCVGALFACEQRAADPAVCRTKAATGCTKAFGKIAAAEDALDAALAKACAAVDFATLAASEGAHVAALAGTCAQHDVPTLDSRDAHARCLVRQHECRVETMIAEAAPRAATLLAGAGFTLRSAFCPGGPPVPTATPAATPQRTATPKPTPTPQPGDCGNGLVDGAREVCDGAALGSATCTSLGFAGGTLACAASCRGFDSRACDLPAAPPPDPATLAPAADLTTVTGLAAAVQFLFAGDPPVQYGVVPGAIDPVAAAVLRGTVRDAAGDPLAGVAIRVLDRPEYGATQSRADGGFDLVVNGGGRLIVTFEKSLFLPAQRPVEVPWQQFVTVDEVRLVALDPASTVVDLAAMTEVAVARGSAESDADGTRRATLLVAPGTAAEMLLPDGSTQPLTQMTIRATEYTVGAAGPARMPAALPPTSGYTYAVEYTLDEAIVAGAPMVAFDRPIVTYVENFPGFPAGTPVPAGFYDHARGAWVAAPNGIVLDVVGITADLADLDVTGDGVADTGAALADLGIDDAERERLAALYTVGTSLWRVPVDHFSTWDYNWPFGPPGDAVDPEESGAGAQSDDEPVDGSCEEAGSVIECENQVLGEDLLLAGTPYTLHYRSDRVPGRIDSLDVRLSGPGALPPSLQSIKLRATVAGHTTEATFAPAPNLSTILSWNGTDPYGRPVQGGQRVTGEIEYVYPATFRSPAEFSQAFAQFGTNTLQANRVASTVSTVMPFEAVLREGITDARGLGLGGWTLGVQHFYDPLTRVLHLGSGGRRRADSVARVIDTFLESTGSLGGSGTLASFTIGPDGSLYFARFDRRIRRLAPDGTETIVAGTGQQINVDVDLPLGFGDGGPATQAKLINFPDKLQLGADGALYFVDNHVLRRVRPDGIIERVAGAYFFDGLQCQENTTPDGAVAFDARLCIDDFAVAPDGMIVLGEFLNGFPGDYRIRRIGSDGTLQTIVGGGGECSFFSGGTCGDGGPAVDARLFTVNHRIALGPDGTLYLSDGNRVRQVTPDGIITNLAGNNFNGFAGDGFPASAATQFCGPTAFAFPPDGSILIADASNHRIRRIAADGLVSTIAGSGGGCVFFNIGQSGDRGPALQAAMSDPRQIALAPDGDLYVMAGFPQRIRRIGPPLPGFDAADILVASEDGRSLYVFDANGKHLATVDALTGALRRELVYDAEGRLAQVVEKTGGTDNVTTIQRDAGGQPTAIVGPFGRTTTLTVDANGFLAALTNPAGETTSFGSSVDGLLTSLTLPGNRTSTFTYDASGRLLTDEDPGNGSQTLAKSGPPEAFTVTRTTALGRATEYAVEQLPGNVARRTVTAPDGTAGTLTDTVDAGRRDIVTPNGTESTLIAGPDPRFGIEAPVATSVTLRFPSALEAVTANARTAALADPFDPLSLVTLGETTTRGGRTWDTTYTAATRTFVTTSPLGRTRSLALDAQGRPVTLQATGFATTAAGYDDRGRLATLTTGSGPSARTLGWTYDAEGLPATFTDPLDHVVAMQRDALGRLTQKTLPDGAVVGFGYDAAGDLTSITPPGRPAHAFAYDARGLLTTITPPAVSGTGATTLAYDDDGLLTAVTRPGETVTFGYDAAGRPTTTQLAVQGGPQGTYTIAYEPTTGLAASVTGPAGAAIAYTYDGALVTSVTWTGPVVGSLTRSYDERLAVTSETAAGVAVAYVHDDDDRLVAAGDLAITRDAATGLPDTTTLGVVGDAWVHDGFGEVAEYAVTANGTPIYEVTYQRDARGRVVEKVETIGGDTDTWTYAYDARGQLVEVERDGATVESYTWDDNGNRTEATVDGTSVTATYDDQDRLLTYGTASFTYAPSGRLATRTVGAATTVYTYDAAGNLLAVALPDGTDVAYALDPGFRRVARTVDGTAAGRFLWVGSRPLAELDGSNALVSRFVYAGGTAPAYLVKGGVAHRLVTDQAGSVRLVVNATTGAVVQRLDYDAFGRVTLDTNPGFQPFGFAGGLYDPATGLVRFDARDYDASVGRWTAKDPIGFAGGDANLYRYVGNDPVNFADPSGLGIGEVVLGVLAGLVDVAMFPATLAHSGQQLASAITEAITGTPQPVPPDPNPIVGVMEGVNDVASTFFGEVEPLADTNGTGFSIARLCASILGSLGGGAAGGVGRGALAGAERAAVQAGTRGTANAIGNTADKAYRPLLSGEAARAERLAAENAKRIAKEEAKKAAQQGSERGRLELVRPEGGGAGTQGGNKPAGGFGIGRE